MNASLRPLVALSPLLLTACAGAPHETAGDRPPAAWTGDVSDTEFEAMHEHSDRVEPDRTGTMIEIDGNRAYLSLPADAKPPLPGIVVIHEWWGLNEHIQHQADRLAAEGYAALAVDLYFGETATDPEGAMALMQAVDTDVAVGILRDAHRFLVEDPRIQAARTGSIGWCFGGGMSLQLALAEPDLDACVIYYGHLVTDPAKLAGLHAEVLGIFGTRDPSIPPDAVADFAEAMTTAGKTFTIRNYDANHAFANPSSARYDEDAASAAWKETRAFLARILKTP
jgi:carboxymethylenebutenolidase